MHTQSTHTHTLHIHTGWGGSVGDPHLKVEQICILRFPPSNISPIYKIRNSFHVKISHPVSSQDNILDNSTAPGSDCLGQIQVLLLMTDLK